MKKFIYSLAMILVGMSSCATFDDPTTENYGAGPDVTLSVTAGTPTDNAFNIQVTPGEGSTYYTMAISTSPEQIDSAVFIKGGYGNTVIKVADLPAINQAITTATPNTTYYVYAVACNDKGVVGKLASASIKTTDAGAPQKAATQVDAASKTAAVAFDQLIQRGEGKVTAKYYKEYDFENPIEIETVDVAISKNVAQMKVDAPEGAYVIFSWEEGAFVDEVGNRCAAYTSTIDMEGEDIDAIFANALWLRVPTTTWAITDDQFTAPTVGGTFPKWNEFEGVIEFKDKVYVLEDEVKDGAFTVTYANEKRTVSYKLPKANITFGLADDLSTQKVTFKLPEATQAGDKVSVSIAEGVFYDVMGNANAAYSSSKVYWIAFAMTPDMALGTFNLLYISYYSETGDVESLGNVTIESDPEVTNGIIVKDLFLKGSTLKGTMGIDECKIYLSDWQILGKYKNSQGTTYGVMFAVSGADKVSFTVNADGTMLADGIWGFYAMDENFETELGWLDVAKASMLVPVKEDASSRAMKTFKRSAKKVSLHKATRNLNKRVSK